MSTVPNFAGGFLSNPSPFLYNYPAINSPWGQFVKPGGRIAAYVRSTGAQDGEDHFAASGLLVATINEGLKRCRSGQNDIVFVLPGHTETYSTTGAVWANLVAGAQIIGCGVPGATNAPALALTHAGASIALNVANVTVAGLNIVGGVATATASVVITGAGCTLAGNFLNFAGAALGANSTVAVTGAATCAIVGNHIVADSTATIVTVTGAASTNMLIVGNLIRQAQGTSGGVGVTVANTAAISGFIANNYIMTATNLGAGAVGSLVTVGAAALPTVGTFENYGADSTGGTGIIAPDANADS